MLCTKCSEVVKPVVAFDIDGTMGDYHGHFLRFLEEYLGTNLGADKPWSYSGHEQFSSWVCRTFGIDYRTWQDIKLAYRQGAQKRSMPAYVGITDLARYAHDMECEVWVTTTRPFQRLDGVDPDTREWLRRNRVPYEGLIYSEDKYHQLGETVDPDRVIAVFDDLPEMINEASIVFGELIPFLVKTPWNRSVRAIHQGGAPSASDHLIARLAAWRVCHEAAIA